MTVADLATTFGPDGRPHPCGAPGPTLRDPVTCRDFVADCNRPAGHAGNHLVTDRDARRLAVWPQETTDRQPRRR